MLPIADADKMRDEVRAAEDLKNVQLDKVDEIIRRQCTAFYNKVRKPIQPSAINYIFDYKALIMPQLAYGKPQCLAKYDGNDPMMAELNEGMQHTVNYLADDELFADESELVVDDSLTCWGVAYNYAADLPGFLGSENLTRLMPQRPTMMRISPYHFAFDPKALSANPLAVNGPRYMMHLWRADIDDLKGDPSFDQKVLASLEGDKDMMKFDHNRDSQTAMPKRNQIVGWSMWVPEAQMSDDPWMNGTILTLAAGVTPDGITKETYMLRPPMPCFCPPWGPYTIFGMYTVLDNPYPLSPIIATAEEGERVNSHLAKEAEDAATYKRNVVSTTKNKADLWKAKQAKHGEWYCVEEAESARVLEYGGTSDRQIGYNNRILDGLNRRMGISQSAQGQPNSGATATAESIAQSGMEGRMAWLQKKTKRGYDKILRSWGHLLWYETAMKIKTASGTWEGGLRMGQESIDPLAVLKNICVESYSMEHQSGAVLQKRLVDLMGAMGQTAPMFTQAPYMPWKQLCQRIFAALDMGDMKIDEQMLARMTGINLMSQPGAVPGVNGAIQPGQPGNMSGQAVGVAA